MDRPSIVTGLSTWRFKTPANTQINLMPYLSDLRKHKTELNSKCKRSGLQTLYKSDILYIEVRKLKTRSLVMATQILHLHSYTSDPEKDSDVKYLSYPFYAGGNRGRGQVYPTGEKSNMNVFGATQAGQITEINTSEKGESSIIVVNANGSKTSQVIPTGLTLIVKQGDVVQTDQALNIDPNAGGFGQEDSEIVLQNPVRIVGYLAFCFCALLTQILLVLKKKQFEKVQAAELNF